MAIVIRFLRKLLCCFLLCFIFCGVFPGFVYADNVNATFTNPYSTIPYYATNQSSSLTSFNVVSTSYTPSLSVNYPSNYDWTNSFGLRLSPSIGSLNRYFYRFSAPLNFPISFDIDLTNKNFQDLTVSYNPQGRLVFSGLTVSNTVYVIGTLTVDFSDGSTISQYFSTPELSFGVSKHPRKSLYTVSSNQEFNLTSKDTASLSGSLSHSGGSINAPVSGQVSGTAQLPDELKADIHAGGTASFSTRGYNGIIKSLYTPSGDQHFQTDNQLEIQQNATGMPIGVRYFNIYASKLAISMQNGTFNADDASIYFGASQAISLTASLVNAKVDSLTVTGAKASSVGTLVAPNSSVDGIMSITPYEEDVTITKVSFSGSVRVSGQSWNLPVTPNSTSYSQFVYLIFNSLVFVNSSDTVAGNILQRLDDIYYFLRVDLPFQLRHLIIPTQEEVKDVLEESFDNIAEEHPGAAGTINIIKGQFSDFNASISGSSTRGLVLPGITVSIPGSGEKVKLWEDFDLLPYLQTGPARSLMYWVELMLKALIFIYLVRQAASMFISAVTGYSYIEWFGLSNKPFMGDDTPGEALPDGYLDREVG